MVEPVKNGPTTEGTSLNSSVLPPMSPWVFDADTADEKIGAGWDSTVYRKGENVYKVYHANIPLERLLAYQKVTNQAAALLRQTPRVIDLGDNLKAIFEIVEIDEIGRDKLGSLVTLSRFVPGPWKIELRAMISEGLDFEIDGLKSKKGKELLGRYQRSKVYIDFPCFLETELGVQGIISDETNIKIGVDEEKGRIRCIITDLCACVAILRYAGLK